MMYGMSKPDHRERIEAVLELAMPLFFLAFLGLGLMIGFTLLMVWVGAVLFERSETT